MEVKIWCDYAYGSTKMVFVENREDGYFVYNLFTGINKKIEGGESVPDDFISRLSF